MSSITYCHCHAAHTHLRGELRGLMEGGAKRFCDVGGGANPIVSLAEIEEFGLDYVVLDESLEELDKAPSGYKRCQANVLDPVAVSLLVDEQGAFDVVVSKWMAEHVPNGRAFHEQVFNMLCPGGTAVHLFPTLYSTVFLLNRLLPPSVSHRVLAKVTTNREAQGLHAKFRPYYSWCRGPSRRQIRRLQGVGFFIERYIGFFGHGYYDRIRPLRRIHDAATNALVRHPLSSRTSFALVVLSRGER